MDKTVHTFCLRLGCAHESHAGFRHRIMQTCVRRCQCTSGFHTPEYVPWGLTYQNRRALYNFVCSSPFTSSALHFWVGSIFRCMIKAWLSLSRRVLEGLFSTQFLKIKSAVIVRNCYFESMGNYFRAVSTPLRFLIKLTLNICSLGGMYKMINVLGNARPVPDMYSVMFKVK